MNNMKNIKGLLMALILSVVIVPCGCMKNVQLNDETTKKSTPTIRGTINKAEKRTAQELLIESRELER